MPAPSAFITGKKTIMSRMNSGSSKEAGFYVHAEACVKEHYGLNLTTCRLLFPVPSTIMQRRLPNRFRQPHR